MSSFERELDAGLQQLKDEGLYREMRRIDSGQGPVIASGGKELLNFSSNDYLGLANEPALKEAAMRAVESCGTGSGASRLISGSLGMHHELEAGLAEFKKTEAALTFSTGYAAALGTIGALVGKDDVVVLDKLVHACIVDAARLSGAKLRIYAHNQLDELEEILKWSRARNGNGSKSRTLIVTESVFSMDGDHAPLAQLVELKERYGAWLMVDEAHATGLYGANRRGLAEEAGVSERIEVQMGTMGKALGVSGGYICGCRVLIETLLNRARTFIFSTAPPPSAAAAALAAIQFVRSKPGAERCQALWDRVGELPSELFPKGLNRKTAILPIMVGDERRAVECAAALRERGFYIPAIRFPTVGRGKARLRLTMTAAHSRSQVGRLVEELRALHLVSPKPAEAAPDYASVS